MEKSPGAHHAPTAAIAAPIGLLDDYLTRPELATELRKSVKTIDRWHRLRVGPPRVRIGNTVLYHRESVRSWLADQAKAAGRGRR